MVSTYPVLHKEAFCDVTFKNVPGAHPKVCIFPAASPAEKQRVLSLVKRKGIMNEWALYKSEEIAKNAVEAAGGPLG